MNNEQLLKNYQLGKRDFVWADLEGACLQGFELSEANFNRAKFAEADLSGADLCKSNFFKADLSHANLTGAKLDGTSFRKANLTGAKIELSAIPCTSLRGAILPDGKMMHLEETMVASPVDPQPDSEPLVAEAHLAESPTTLQARAQDLELVSGQILDPTSDPISDPDSEVIESPTVPTSQWAQGIQANGAALDPTTFKVSVEPEPEVPLPPPPKTWKEVWQVMPATPLSLFVFGYFVDGLTLHFSAAGGSAWVISAIATLLWAIQDTWTWFIPIVVGLAALYGGPLGFASVLFGLIVPSAIFLMLLGGLLVSGWYWRKALHGAFWISGLSAIGMGLVPWLVMPVEPLAVIAPTALLAVMLLIAIGCISIGLTTRGAMVVARMNLQQQRVVMASGGVIGLALGRLVGAFFG